jgi:hypothetical protein
MLVSAPLNGAYLMYQSKSGWSNAVAGIYETENFNDMALNPGLTFAGEGGIHAPPAFGAWVSAGLSSVVFMFETPISAVGADWDLSYRGPGTGVHITLHYAAGGSESLLFELPNTADGDFYGVISDIPLSAISFTGGTQEHEGGAGQDRNEESLWLDNLVYAMWSEAGGGEGGNGPPPPPQGGEIPEPATVLLTGLGLTTAAWMRGRRA